MITSFSDSTSTKDNWNEMSMVPDLADYPLNHEVMGTIVYFTGPFTNTSEIDVHVKFYNNNTGTLLWEGHQYIPTPASQGHEWWDWYKTNFWIGHASWEIDGPMTIRAEINISGWISGSATIYLDVIDTSVPQGVRAINFPRSMTNPKICFIPIPPFMSLGCWCWDILMIFE